MIIYITIPLLVYMSITNPDTAPNPWGQQFESAVRRSDFLVSRIPGVLCDPDPGRSVGSWRCSVEYRCFGYSKAEADARS